MDEYTLSMLPPEAELETKAVLKQLSNTSRALAELKGYSDTIPNKNILINAVLINEAKDSSAIENIVTTHDELYQAMTSKAYRNSSAKEVENYRNAIWHGYELVKKDQILTTNRIIDIQKRIENNEAGIRKVPGTVLMNDSTGEVIYTPPSGEREILELMANLEKYINEDYDNVDPLVKLAIIHYQFESIHPFYDGNGRTGRIINVLYLVLKGLLDSPILYLSKYIINNKSAYYRLLQEIRTRGSFEEWILYILAGIEETAEESLKIIKGINREIELMTQEIKAALPKIYTKELIELIFFEFYTKSQHLEKGLGVTRKTAAGYLTELEKNGFLVSEKIGKERIYQNKRLYDLIKRM